MKPELYGAGLREEGGLQSRPLRHFYLKMAQTRLELFLTSACLTCPSTDGKSTDSTLFIPLLIKPFGWIFFSLVFSLNKPCNVIMGITQHFLVQPALCDSRGVRLDDLQRSFQPQQFYDCDPIPFLMARSPLCSLLSAEDRARADAM